MKKYFQHEQGFTILVAMVVTATLLLVATSVAAIAARETALSTVAVQSQYAFYAADTGAECAVFWDVKNPAGYSAFSTSTASTIHCNQDENNPSNPASPANIVGGSAESDFRLTFLPDPYCVDVKVTKPDDGSTKVEAFGYNTCDTANPRRVERAVRVTY